MIRKTLHVFAFFVTISGCANSTTTSLSPLPHTVDQELIPGREYIVETTRPSDGATLTYQGKVVRDSEDSVVLDCPTVTARQTHSPPIPGIGKLFKNSSMAVAEVDGEAELDRDRIIAIRSQIQ